MTKFKKAEWTDDLLGKKVTVITNEGARSRGFEVNKAYKGRLMGKVDWMVGCPVFKCEIGMLGLNYECYLVEKLD